MNWSQDVILEFLTLYKNKPCLWDPNHALNKNRNKRLESWVMLQESLSERYELIDIKRKKESLMAHYRLCLRRRNQERRAGNKNYESAWFAFALMDSFLGSLYKTETEDITDEEYIEYVEEDFDDKFNNTIDSPLSRKRSRSSNVVQKDQDDPLDSESELQNSVNCIAPTINERHLREPDECELYGQLLALKLKKFDEHQRSVVMNGIDNLVFNAIMKYKS